MNIPFLPVDPTKFFILDLEHPKTWFGLGVIIKLQQTWHTSMLLKYFFYVYEVLASTLISLTLPGSCKKLIFCSK